MVPEVIQVTMCFNTTGRYDWMIWSSPILGNPQMGLKVPIVSIVDDLWLSWMINNSLEPLKNVDRVWVYLSGYPPIFQ